MVFAVNTESGIQDIRDLLVFLWPAGHSFANGIVVPAGGGRNDAPVRSRWRRGAAVNARAAAAIRGRLRHEFARRPRHEFARRGWA
jgi:hypothetical protein